MKAEYISHMGSDLTVVNAARVSFDKTSHWEFTETDPHHGGKTFRDPHLSERDVNLIRFLAKNGHFTPFTHCVITMRETVPIFVARQRFKHTVGFSYNEVSRRYVDDPPTFYRPDSWRGRPVNSKQGSSDIEIDINPTRNGSKQMVDQYEQLLKTAEYTYAFLLGQGVAPEQARMCLPQSMYTSYYVTGSLEAWARAYRLRIEDSAQKEIRDLAIQWDTLMHQYYPVSWKFLTWQFLTR